MITQQAQIKINLPLALMDYISSRAAKFDLPVATYIKHLIIQDAGELEYPTFPASKGTEKAYQEAMANQDKAIPIDDVDEFFKNLKKKQA